MWHNMTLEEYEALDEQEKMEYEQNYEDELVELEPWKEEP